MVVINNEADRNKLKHLADEAVKVLQEVQDLKGGLRDTVKAVSEEMEIEPTMLNSMIKLAFKESQKPGSISSDDDVHEGTRQLLHSVGII